MTFFSLIHLLFFKIVFLCHYLCYEIKYYLLGVGAVVEDVFLCNKNKCVLYQKSGEVAVVTGGARGIGATLVEKLLQCDMHVIIGCRNQDAGNNFVQKVRERGIQSGTVTVLELNLASLSSIKKFAEAVSKVHTKINLLVNNAGIMFVPYKETKDGFESHWAVNYLGPFFLTHLLLPLLQKSSPESQPRIVNVTSCAHNAAKPISLENISMKNNYIPSASYAQSKLAQVLFTVELDRRLKERNQNIDVFATHPGIVNTDIFNGTFFKIFFPWVLKYVCKDVDQGATTVLFTCISPKLRNKGGSYLSNCRVVPPSILAQNNMLQKEVFTYSLHSLNIKDFGMTEKSPDSDY